MSACSSRRHSRIPWLGRPGDSLRCPPARSQMRAGAHGSMGTKIKRYLVPEARTSVMKPEIEFVMTSGKIWWRAIWHRSSSPKTEPQLLERTFIHIPGIGRVTERALWRQGVKTWSDAEALEPGAPIVRARAVALL